MKYEECADESINVAVSFFLDPKGNTPIFDLNNHADWAMLIKEMTPNFTVEFCDNYVTLNYCNGITMDPISERYGSIGRAISICYLKSFDLLEDVKRLDIKNKKDEEVCYSEGFSSAKNDANPYLFVFNPWAYTPWKRGHADKWEANNA